MRIVKNLIKYILGLPLLLMFTLICGLVYYIAFIMGDEFIKRDVISQTTDMWKVLK